jgi:hypothetical protein
MTLRPFCRDERNGHTCHRMLGHAGPHIERRCKQGQDQGDTRWYAEVTYTGPMEVASA